MSKIEGTYEQVSRRLASFEQRFDSVDRRFDAIDWRFDSIDRKVDERFMWTIGIVLGAWITTIIAILVHR